MTDNEPLAPVPTFAELLGVQPKRLRWAIRKAAIQPIRTVGRCALYAPRQQPEMAAALEQVEPRTRRKPR